MNGNSAQPLQHLSILGPLQNESLFDLDRTVVKIMCLHEQGMGAQRVSTLQKELQETKEC